MKLWWICAAVGLVVLYNYLDRIAPNGGVAAQVLTGAVVTLGVQWFLLLRN